MSGYGQHLEDATKKLPRSTMYRKRKRQRSSSSSSPLDETVDINNENALLSQQEVSHERSSNNSINSQNRQVSTQNSSASLLLHETDSSNHSQVSLASIFSSNSATNHMENQSNDISNDFYGLQDANDSLQVSWQRDCYEESFSEVENNSSDDCSEISEENDQTQHDESNSEFHTFNRLLEIINSEEANEPLNTPVMYTYGKFNRNHIDAPSFIDKSHNNPLPIYSILREGNDKHPIYMKLQIDQDVLVKMYKMMISLNVMDSVLYECQRQGRISFYMTNFGEEAVQIGSAAALSTNDLVYAQYRESGVLLWRGFNYSDFINQCFGNQKDRNKGRQMPVHYGARSLNFVTISSPLATQLPQAVGAAYGLKNQDKNVCVACYFGEGAASEGDTHAAFNFAATLECPILFICRNNGYAISTPTHQQYKGDGIAAKGLSYGINSIRVDGNDLLAMYQVTKAARDYIMKEKKPVVIEALTYRIGHHSTSDDSSAYRPNEERFKHMKNTPILRFKKYLENIRLWDDEKEEKLYCNTKNQVIYAIAEAEKEMKPNLKELFLDVYKKSPNRLLKQWNFMKNHINKYSRSYSEL